jgi:predicted secreted protein
VLHLSETATVMATPDEIAASLRADAALASPSDAQARVNVVMRDALAQAHKVASIVVSTGGYSVWRAAPTPTDHSERWQVSQILNLTGHDGPALLTLVGDLQQHGLAVSSLGWRLSHAAELQARQEATKEALSALRGRAEQAAALLDLRFDQFKDVRLDNAAPPPGLPRLSAPMALNVTATPAPSATIEDMPVRATADAEAILVPR